VIPEGATFESATLHIYADQAYGHTINIHRITAEWDEMTVTWSSFGGAYDATVENSFATPTVGWYAVDVSDLVLGWMLETYPNYGLLLDQGVEVYPMTRYRSKESETNKPYIEVCYTYEGDTECETDISQQDTFIWELWPGSNYGDWPAIFTGWETPTNLEKQALLQFDFEYTPPNGGLLTPTGVEPEDILAGDYPDLVMTVNPRGKIAPGGFFYYNLINGTGDMTIEVTHSVNPDTEPAPDCGSNAKVYIVVDGFPVNISNSDGVQITYDDCCVTFFVPETYVNMSDGNTLLTKVHCRPPDTGQAGTEFCFYTSVNGVPSQQDCVVVIPE
jgi:hypothetical protein